MQPRYIAHLTPIVPAAGGNGLAMRTGMFAEAAALAGSRQVIVIGDDRTVENMPKLEASLTHIPVCGRLDTHLQLINNISDVEARSQALVSFGRPDATAILSAPVLKDIANELEKHRLSCIILSRAHLLPVLKIIDAMDRQIPVIVDLDDDDADLNRAHARIARSKRDCDQAAMFDAEAAAYDRMILAAADRVEMFTCASQTVASTLGTRLGLKNIKTIFNGVNLTKGSRMPPATPNFLFVGNLSYAPNIDGICWFIENVWPLLHRQFPGLSLTVAGSRPDPRVISACTASKIKLCANPDNLRRLYNQATAAVVPLRLGSGSRLKILEAGAHGVPVISTTQGAEGIEIEPGHHLFQSDAVETEFTRVCLKCLADMNQAEMQAKNLYFLVKEHYNRSNKIEQIAALISSVVR